MTHPVVNLGSVVTIKGGGTPARKTPEYWGGEIPWVTVKDLKSQALGDTQEAITAEGLQNSASNLIPAGTVVTATRMALGRAAITEQDIAINQDLKALFCNEAITPRYLLHFLKANKSKIESMGKGATVKGITLDALSGLKIPLPPLEEQKRIAAVLDKADAIRKKRQKAIDLTDQFLRSAFLDMFGNPITNPKGWSIEKLGNHLAFVTSGSRGWAKYYSQTGARFIRSLDVQMNRLANEDIAFVQPPESAESARTLVRAGDVLLTITGSRIGRVSAVPDNVGEAYISQHVAILRVNKAIEPRFLSMFLSDPLGGQYQIASMQYGQTKPGLNLEQIRNFSILLPPIQKQKEFITLWDRVLALNTELKDSSFLSHNQFDSLIQYAFRGSL